MIPPPSVSHLMAGGIFYRPHLLAFLDCYSFYYSQRLRKRAHRLAVSRAAVGTAQALRCHTHNFVTLTNLCHAATKLSRSFYSRLYSPNDYERRYKLG